jgi:hypothetical protein
MGRYTWILAIAAVMTAASNTRAAETATATVNLLSSGGGLNNYGITVDNTGTTAIGTFWFAWTAVPFDDFLASKPTNIGEPAGWIAPIDGPVGSPDGYSIEYYNIGGSPIAPGQSSSQFTFSSPDTPAELAGDSVSHPGIPVTTSIIYIGFPESDPGFTLVATVAPVPEPRSLAMFALVAGCGCAGRGAKRRCWRWVGINGGAGWRCLPERETARPYGTDPLHE